VESECREKEIDMNNIVESAPRMNEKIALKELPRGFEPTDAEAEEIVKALADPDRKPAQECFRLDIEGQREMLSLAMHSRDFARAIAPIIFPKHFSEEKHQTFYRMVRECVTKFDEIPSKTALKNDVLAELKKNEKGNDILIDTIGELNTVYDYYHNSGTSEYYLAKARGHAENHAFAEYQREMVDALKSGRKPDTQTLLKLQFSFHKLTAGTINRPEIESAGELIRQYPALRPPIIEGLLRRGEIINIIAAPKTGKSWLILQMVMAVTAGKEWLNFPCRTGKVLLIDNELHKETLTYRLAKMGERAGLTVEQINSIDVLSLRGRILDIDAIGDALKAIPQDKYDLIIIDAFYRIIPDRIKDDNANAEVTKMYNQLDSMAEATGSAIALVHHTSKGNQSEKSVTDTGSGAGAQSRAADTHFVLRPHEEEDVVVADAVVRSFPPIHSTCWKIDKAEQRFIEQPDLDPEKLKTARKKKEKDEPWTTERFVSAYLTEKPKTLATMEEEAIKAEAKNLSGRKIKNFCDLAVELGLAGKISATTGKNGEKTRYVKMA
jgi:hypothetical protein